MYKSDRPNNMDFLKKCHNTEKYDIMSAEAWPYNEQTSDEIGQEALKAQVCEFR